MVPWEYVKETGERPKCHIGDGGGRVALAFGHVPGICSA